jgi:hypothetical protein
MQRLTLTTAVAAMLFGGVLAGTPAKADHNYGPMKNGAQCYKGAANGWGSQGYGYWASCPGPAATGAPAAHHHSKKG